MSDFHNFLGLFAVLIVHAPLYSFPRTAAQFE